MKRAAIIRSGGLGDFVLTLPLMRALRQKYPEVTLITRPGFRSLLDPDRLFRFLDLDGPDFCSLFTARPSPRLRAVCEEADLYSFLPDTDGELRAGLERVRSSSLRLLQPRPQAPPHVAERMFLAAGLPVPEDLLTTSCLLRQGAPAGGVLWLHPGSGSSAKNAPAQLFAERAHTWCNGTGGRCIVSFGEADGSVRKAVREAFSGLPVEWVDSPPLPDLRRLLAEKAAGFVGNDTGVTHLAAATGIPTEAIFISTEPAIWRPLGASVTVTRVPSICPGRHRTS